MLNDYTFGFKQTPPERGWHAWMHRERPALAAAVWFWPIFLLLAIITLFTGWASLPITLTLQVVVSLGAGWKAARLNHRDYLFDQQINRYRPARMGAFAGIYLALTTTIVLILVAVWAGIGSLGTLVPLMIPYFISLPLVMAFCGLAGWIGGWLGGRRST